MNATDVELECVFPGICHLGEGPVWNVSEQKLYWTDIYNKRLWVLDPGTGQSRVFWEGNLQVGGFAFTKRGGLVLCADQSVYLLRRQSDGEPADELETLFELPIRPPERINDITVDPKGRIYAGTAQGADPVNSLFRIEKGKEPVVVIDGIACSNGMTFSIDVRVFYHTDTCARRINRYAWQAETGELSEPAVLFQGTEEQGLPDGLTIDTDGHLWSAFWGAGVVRRLSPEGGIVEEIPVPAKQPSSVMFGGDDLGDLYITSACQGAADLEQGTAGNGEFLGGPLYRFRTRVRGRAEWLADF